MAIESEQMKDALVLAKRIGKPAFKRVLRAAREHFVGGIALYVLNERPSDSAKKTVKQSEDICALLEGIDKADAILKRLK